MADSREAVVDGMPISAAGVSASWNREALELARTHRELGEAEFTH